MRQKQWSNLLRRHPNMSADFLKANDLIETLAVDETTYIIPDNISNFRKYLYEQAKKAERHYKTITVKKQLKVWRIR